MNKLSLSSSNKRIAGVCGGIADYFCLEPALVRIIWILLALIFGGHIPFMLLLYLLCWAIFPKS